MPIACRVTPKQTLSFSASPRTSISKQTQTICLSLILFFFLIFNCIFFLWDFFCDLCLSLCLSACLSPYLPVRLFAHLIIITTTITTTTTTTIIIQFVKATVIHLHLSSLFHFFHFILKRPKHNSRLRIRIDFARKKEKKKEQKNKNKETVFDIYESHLHISIDTVACSFIEECIAWVYL